MEALEMYEKNQKKLIAALINKNREVNFLNRKNKLYAKYLTPRQKKLADRAAVKLGGEQ